jgi:biotin carboxylase
LRRAWCKRPFTVACTAAELIAAAKTTGLPLLVKPVDGFGSQNAFVLRAPNGLDL